MSKGTMIEDVTDREISDMRYAPGERADRFRRAVGARAVTPAISAVLDRVCGVAIGYVSKPMLYADALRHWSARDCGTLYRALKGGLVRLVLDRTDPASPTYRLVRAPGPARLPNPALATPTPQIDSGTVANHLCSVLVVASVGHDDH